MKSLLKLISEKQIDTLFTIAVLFRRLHGCEELFVT